MSDMQISAAPDSADIIFIKDIPQRILDGDISSDIRSSFFADLARIRNFYEIYNRGVDFKTEGTKGDYVPARLFYKKCRKLIDDESRFMFCNTPDMRVVGKNAKDTAEMKNNLSVLNNYIAEVLDKNTFATKLIKAAKDCFIAGRVCLVANFNENGIQIDFVNALEFYYEYTGNDLSRLIIFCHTNNAVNKNAQRIMKKKYEMVNGSCYVSESMYDGSGRLLAEPVEIVTGFDFIPAVVILNDGLTGDTIGESEIDIVDDFEEYYSKLANADKDALRKSMNGIKYIIDASRESTADLGTGPGVIWDLQSDIELHENGKAAVGQLEPSMSYKDALKSTLDRVENNMYGMLSIPNVTGEQLQGVITSGKTLRALYWPMVVRCGEKSNVWVSALTFLLDCIIKGSLIVPAVVSIYSDDTLPSIGYKTVIETNYALPDDEGEEKSQDLQQVNSQVMSRKAFMIKWRGLTEEEADAELQQILFEKQLLEDSAFDTRAFGTAAPQALPDEEPEEDEEPETEVTEDEGQGAGAAPGEGQEEEPQEQKKTEEKDKESVDKEENA